MNNQDPRAELNRLFDAGVEAVKGQTAVAHALKSTEDKPFDAVLAVGKAAASMYLGALPYLTDHHRALVITKHGHAAELAQKNRRAEVLESSHPIPDAASLYAGARALSFVKDAPVDERLLVLVSGGASSLVEVLTNDLSLDEYQSLNQDLIASGADIAAINQQRIKVSQIKGGQLLAHFPGQNLLTLAVSDVAGDDIGVIGSGIGACHNPAIPFEARVVASNASARQKVCDLARASGCNVVANEEILYGDMYEVAGRLHGIISAGPDGLYIFGGEPTVRLPSNPGVGGRNQALALCLAEKFDGMDAICGLVAGTDGTDGPTSAAGAYVTGSTFRACDGALEALHSADSGSYLARAGDLFVTGPTGTNVMDLVLMFKETR